MRHWTRRSGGFGFVQPSSNAENSGDFDFVDNLFEGFLASASHTIYHLSNLAFDAYRWKTRHEQVVTDDVFTFSLEMEGRKPMV